MHLSFVEFEPRENLAEPLLAPNGEVELAEGKLEIDVDRHADDLYREMWWVLGDEGGRAELRIMWGGRGGEEVELAEGELQADIDLHAEVLFLVG